MPPVRAVLSPATLVALLAALPLTPAGSVPVPPAVDSLCRAMAPGDGYASTPVPVSRPVPDLTSLQDLRRDMQLDGLPVGGDGTGVRVGVVEYDWNPDHVELDGRVPARPGYRRANGPADVSHGTASLSLIGARRDGQGITGIAPAAVLQPISPLRGPTAADYSPATAVSLAAARLRPGDVLLVELQSAEQGPVDTGEWGPAVADAVSAAVASGIVVVLPAGNAGRDVADFGLPATDAGIVVGAGVPSSVPGMVPASRWAGGNHGGRVDVQGPGFGVVTATAFPSYYGTLIGGESDPNSSYTHCFNGTSSAAAAVAGAIAAMQGVALAGRGVPFTPAEVLARLTATGRAQPDPGAGRVGVLPQIRAASDLTPPPAPSALSPSGPALVSAGEVTLRWTSAPEDAGGSGRGDDAVLVDGAEVVRVAAGVGEAHIRMTAGRHTWRVISFDRAGNASTGEATADADTATLAKGALTTPAVPAAGRVRSARRAGRGRTVILGVVVRAGAVVRADGRRLAVRAGAARVTVRRRHAVRLAISGSGMRTVTYLLAVPVAGRPTVTRVR